MSTQLPGYPVTIVLPVQWGEQDSFGHVNNIIHLRWFESARIAYLERAGLWQMYETEGIGPILASITCHYRRPVHFPDAMIVGARVTSLGRSSFRMEHLLVSQRSAETMAEGDSVLVMFDYNEQKPIPIPAAARQRMAEIEGKPLEKH